MIKVILLVSLCFNLVNAKELNFYDIQAYIANKYKYTVIVDSNIRKSFILYSENVENDLTIDNFKRIMLGSGFNYTIDKKFIYITNVSETEKELEKKDLSFVNDLTYEKKKFEYELEKKDLMFAQQQKHKIETEKQPDKIYRDTIISSLDQSKVQEICKSYDYQCLYLSDSKYMLTSKIPITEKDAFMNNTLLTNYALVGEIIEIKKDDFDKKNIDISNLLSIAMKSNYLDFSLTAEQGTFFSGLQDKSKVSVTALFQYFKSKGMTKTISNPYLALTDNKKTTFSSGQELSVKSSESVNTEKGISNYTYKNVTIGIDITATPQYQDNNVLIDLNLNISSLLDYDDEKNLVNISTRKISGFYKFTENKQVKIVSYENTFLKNNSHKVPILGDIPLIKNFFTSKLNDKQNSIIFIIFTLEKVT